MRRAVVANGVAPPRWWREWTPEERRRQVVVGMQLYRGIGRFSFTYNQLLALLDHSGYEPHYVDQSESDTSSEPDKPEYGTWLWEQDPNDPDEDIQLFYPERPRTPEEWWPYQGWEFPRLPGDEDIQVFYPADWPRRDPGPHLCVFPRVPDDDQDGYKPPADVSVQEIVDPDEIFRRLFAGSSWNEMD